MQKIGNFGRPSWPRFGFKNRIFWGSKKVSKIKLIFKAFWLRFWHVFREPRNVNNEQKRGRVALFWTFGGCKIRCRFGIVVEGSGGGFSELSRRFWVDFESALKSAF